MKFKFNFNNIILGAIDDFTFCFLAIFDV
jgi:hypothetical protein